MARLNKLAQRVVVRSLAHFMSPTEVAEALEQQLGIRGVSLRQIAYYNPELRSSDEISKELREYFEAERKRAMRELDAIPVYHLGYRLRRSQRRMEALDTLGNYVCAQAIQDAAAKDAGGLNTNKLNLNHSGTVRQKVVVVRSLEELDDVDEPMPGENDPPHSVR